MTERKSCNNCADSILEDMRTIYCTQRNRMRGRWAKACKGHVQAKSWTEIMREEMEFGNARQRADELRKYEKRMRGDWS